MHSRTLSPLVAGEMQQTPQGILEKSHGYQL
jgi:hypothetical protein